MNKESYDRNDAIVAKLQNILDNVKLFDSITIVIEVSRGEVPEIRYNIKEFIVPLEGD